MKGLKLLYLGLAFLCAGIGAVGVVLPILPTTPFLLLASFLFAKGSDRFHHWFTETKLYKKHLESFVESRGMTLKTKLCILLPVSAMLILTMLFLNHIHARIAIGILIVVKYWYFFFRIETIKEDTITKEKEVGGRSLTKEEIADKREKELKVSTLMIEVYCKGHKHGKVPCEDCKALIDYATMRIAKCPFMEEKTYCSNCKVHCYKPEMREKMKEVMRYSGPRMLCYHPVMAIDHVIKSLRNRHHREDKK